RSHGLARRDVLLDDPSQDLALPRCQLHLRPMVAADPAGITLRSGHELGSYAAAQEPSAPCEPELLPAPVRHHLDELELHEAGQRAAIERMLDVRDDDRLVEPQAKQ